MAAVLSDTNRLARQPRRSAAPGSTRARAFRQARRHSALVRLLRLVLPLAAVATLGLYVVGAPLTFSIGDGKLGLDGLSINPENLTMSRPVYEGFTDNDGRYVVKAESATQRLDKPDLVGLERVSAKLTEADGGSAELVAASGQIDTKKETMQLGGGIVVTSSDGLKATLKTALLNLKTKRIISREPVKVEMPNGTVASRQLDIFTEEKRVLFKSKVVTNLVPPAKQAAAGSERKATGFASAAAFGDGPINIQSESLDIRDAEKTALFSGNVRGRQAGTQFTAPTMRVTYTGDSGLDPSAAAAGTGTEISKIESKGGVVITTDDGRIAKSDWSIYDRLAQTVTLGGTVSLADGDNRIEGNELLVDLEKSISTFKPGGRVKGVIGGGKADAKAKPRKKVKPKSGGGTALGGLTNLSADDSGPTEIEANSLEVHDTQGLAIFRGDVIANRGGQQIKAERLDVSYASTGGNVAPAGQDNIRSITATGNVVVSAPDDRVVTGDKLVYDAKSGLITVAGNVTTSQGKNVIKGDKLVINLETGESSFDTVTDEAAKGVKKRIKMLINPSDVSRTTN
ncbi:MAG: LptA/OstA family protein [Hyphomicrobiaceae bacterium]